MLAHLWFLLGISHSLRPHEFLPVSEVHLRHCFSINLSRFPCLGYDTPLLWILTLFPIYLSQGISQPPSWALQIQRIRHIPCPQDVHKQASDDRQGQRRAWDSHSGKVIATTHMGNLPWALALSRALHTALRDVTRQRRHLGLGFSLWNVYLTNPISLLVIVLFIFLSQFQ